MEAKSNFNIDNVNLGKKETLLMENQNNSYIDLNAAKLILGNSFVKSKDKFTLQPQDLRRLVSPFLNTTLHFAMIIILPRKSN
jgi:hypothetical protein